ncbi:deleted in malignant brain tumors 1 protein-like [Mercenaria mercenaria]|uniref:deleted in malignant brain tumors 1 protein-like n=1 Tax=Mercenaria mercenaria TaxID=6596 RepID=UPI00234E6830|nr:deleted in malignant brain tumors 1 protein-like [Mercenaria mercenaria]
MVKVQLCFQLLCVVRVFGGRLEQLEERVMAIQTLTFQDINKLRESVDRNYGEIQLLTKFINITMSQVIQAVIPVSTTTQDQTDGTWSPKGNEMKSDLIRLKRAFRDQKASVQTLHSELDDKLENLRNELKLHRRETLNITKGQSKEILDKIIETTEAVNSVWSMATDTMNGITEIQEKLNSTADDVTNTINRALMNTTKLIEAVSRNSNNTINLLYTFHMNKVIKLVGSTSSGRLEVFLNGEWGTVCDDSFDTHAANVVCKMLGYGRGEYYGRARYGQGTGPILLDNVDCTGNESILFDCEIDYDTSDCGHHEDVGVSCTR